MILMQFLQLPRLCNYHERGLVLILFPIVFISRLICLTISPHLTDFFFARGIKKTYHGIGYFFQTISHIRNYWAVHAWRRTTCCKLSTGMNNSLLYQSVNSPYGSWWRIRWRIMSFCQSKTQNSHFQDVIL